jgi:H+/Cl- antiporter ClcA
LRNDDNGPEIRSPWVTGSFYLAALAIVVSLLLPISKVVTPILVPLVIIGALFGVSVVGAFQLRHDHSLDEKTFLSLMALTFKHLPLVGKAFETHQTKKSDK